MNRKDEQKLLRALAAWDGGESGPVAVEAQIRAAARKVRYRRRARMWGAPGILALAAAAGLVAWIGGNRQEPRQITQANLQLAPLVTNNRPVGESHPQPSPGSVEPVDRIIDTSARTAHVQNRSGRAAVPRRRAPANTTAQIRPSPPAAAFIPVGVWQANEPMERASILRTRMVNSALLSFGIPVDPDRWNGTVPVDVMLSEDGLVRAVRVITTQH